MPDPSLPRTLATPVQASACVYLALRPPAPSTDTAADLALRWRRLSASLSAQGADGATVEAIWARVARIPASPARYAVIAAGGEIRHAETLMDPAPPGPPSAPPGASAPAGSPAGLAGSVAAPGLGAAEPDVARFGAPAYLLPLLSHRQHHPPYVLVVTDRTGAEITSMPRGAASGFTATVLGPDDVIESNAPGGWAQARYQRRAVDSWQHNAAAVAQVAAQALKEVDAQLLLVAGDVRAVALMREQLPSSYRRGVRVYQVSSGNPAAVSTVVADYAADHLGQALDRFAAQLRPGGLAVTDAGATLAALEARRVRVLLVPDDPSDERLAWFGPETLCVKASGAGTRAGRLVDVAVRAALLTDAEVLVVPPDRAADLEEGVGALCRFG